MINARSVKNKCCILRDLITDNNIDILCITETWLSDFDTAVVAALVPPTHIFYHSPRSEGRGGGVGVAVAKCLTNVKSFRRQFDTFECLEVQANHNNKKIIIYVIYRPPSVQVSHFLPEFESFLLNSETAAHDITYVGDFNIWIEDPENSISRRFLDLLCNFNLRNYVLEPTYDSGHVLDLVISKSMSSIVNRVIVEDVFTISDHKLVSFVLNADIKRVHEKEIFFRSSAELNSIEYVGELSMLLDNIHEGVGGVCCGRDNRPSPCVDCIVEKYRECAQAFFDKHAPLVHKVIKISGKKQPWFNSDIRDAKRTLRKAENKYKKFKTLATEEDYKRLRLIKCNLVTSSKVNYYKNKISECNNNSSKLYYELNKMLGRTSENVILPKHSCLKVLANNFKDFFISKIDSINSIFQGSNASIGEMYPDFPLKKFSEFAPVSDEKLEKVISRVKRTFCLNDPINVKLLNFDVIMKPFVGIMGGIVNRSFQCGEFPQAEKFAYIKPVVKGKCDPDDFNSYRPLYNTSFTSKILESESFDQLMGKLKNFACFPKFQSAYREFHSVETAMCRVYNQLIKTKCSGKCTLLVLLDLSAAFDTVDHEILLNDLRLLGLDGNVLSWYRSYLTNRKFKVVIDQVTSDPGFMRTGVPQGSILGPVLFIIYIMELQYLLEGMNVSFHFYADDTQIFFEIADLGQAQRRITEVLEVVKLWMKGRRLKLNTGKTEFILIGQKKCSYGVAGVRGMDIGGTVFEFSDAVRSLGILVDKNLDMHDQLKNVKRKAIGNLINISRISRYIDESSRMKLVHGLVMSHIDFCNSLYCGLPSKDLQPLQLIINGAARMVVGLPYFSRERITPYCIRLHFLPLKARIKYKICLLTFKAIKYGEPQYLRELLVRCDLNEHRSLRSVTDEKLV